MCSNKLAVLAFALLAAVPAFAQRTIVSGTVKDTNGLVYAQASLTVTLSLPTGALGAYLNGAQIAGTVGPVQLDATGSFLVQLADNTLIQCANAAGQLVACAPQTKWNFAVTLSPGVPPPLGTGPQTCSSLLTVTGASQSVSSNFSACPALSASGGGVTTIASIPGQPGLNAVPVTSGLLAEYRILPGENPASLIDYSGNGRNATGTAGTAPTIIAATGGIQCNANGGVILPTSVSPALDVFVYVGFQSSFAGNATAFAPVFANGNGTANNAAGFYLSIGFSVVNLAFPNFFSTLIPNIGISGPTLQTENGFYGNGVLEWQLGTGVQDHMFINGTETTYVGNPNTGSGGVTTTPFQLCGTAIGSGIASFQTYYQGQLYYAAFYNRVLNSSERAAVTNYLSSAMANRGVPAVNQLIPSPGNTAVFEGDSISMGAGTTHAFPTQTFLNGAWTKVDRGQSGVQISELAGGLAEGPIDRRYFQSNSLNASFIFLGTNDVCLAGFTAAQAFANHLIVAQSVRSYGGVPFLATMLSRTACDTAKNGLNALLRQNSGPVPYTLVDFASDPNLGADGANASAVYFQGDHVHPTDTGQINDLAYMTQRAINRFYGAKNFSTATVYSSAAAAAVATTAGSESGNTVTLTFAATPANCLSGNRITVAGVTPAGYNSTTANGAGPGGTFTILTSTGTQVTYWTNATGLGAVTVQGTGVCPQTQDADQYAVLNFTGNHTLDSCVGYTGQLLYRQNINAGAITLVPLGSETITGAGAAPTTLAANTTAILQSQLVSASAAGCSWVRLQ
jgi:hypothetical protein